MITTRQSFPRAALLALLAGGLFVGCVRLRPPTVPAAVPAGYQGAALAAHEGFHAVYDGELRIWFHSFRAIWYVAVSPGGTNLAAAVLSPTGIKIMQMHGDPTAHECVVAIPAAERLHPYGAALWRGLWWSLAAGAWNPETEWVRQGDTVWGCVTQGEFQALYQAEAADETIAQIDLREAGRRRYAIRLADIREDAGRVYPGQIRIECARPRCRLTLTLKSIRWSGNPGEAHRVTGP